MKPAIRVMRDGREVINTNCREGKALYRDRVYVAWVAQGGICAGACKKPIPFDFATADHIKPRGMGGGSRDDRQENIQAMCWWCNSLKGSKR